MADKASSNGTVDPDEPVLTVESLSPKRPTIDLEGEVYELCVPGELGVVEQQQHRADGEEFTKLWGEARLSDSSKKRLKVLLDRMFDRVTNPLADGAKKVPTDVKARMDDELRQKVVVAFMRGPTREMLAQIAEMERTAIGSTSEN